MEFEFRSSNFKAHGHSIKDCDVIICWEHDWADCPLEVIELRSAILDMKNVSIRRPDQRGTDRKAEDSIDGMFAAAGSGPEPQRWWSQIATGLKEHDEEIWFNPGAKYCGIYSPEKAFASWKAGKRSVQFECYTRGKPLPGAKTSSRFSPHWARFTVAQESDVEAAVQKLLESRRRLKAAVKAGERTSYYAYGEPFGQQPGSEDAREEEPEAVPGDSGPA